MNHTWQMTEDGQIDTYAYNPYGSNHNGPKCTHCGLQFCISCNPEFLETECTQFIPLPE